MGTVEEQAGGFIYRQDNGEVTASFENIKEKMVLSHEGSPRCRHVFNLLVLAGGLYLAYIFTMI